ncbi:MAG: hypothetical protein EZS28_012157 [Streblomastix strix]|uniref:B30.2/SPRY domain-containing protein n=1 Tax=Streblomastix strix TaxID=222440 RepID=A0A5J4WBK3_9EUKA|nr:MAG: hypothetical protein EZS28_012157 [Streblomastix strix]
MSVAHTHLNPSEEDVLVEGETFTHTRDNYHGCTILFNPLINSGIYRFEVSNEHRFTSIGIADDSLPFGQDEVPSKYGWTNVVEYMNDGGMHHIGNLDGWIKGNDPFNKPGDRVALELDMDSSPRTLTFFVNDVEQKNYLTNIPAAVNFYGYIFDFGASFKVVKFKRLAKITSTHGFLSKKWEWGKEWK